MSIKKILQEYKELGSSQQHKDNADYAQDFLNIMNEESVEDFKYTFYTPKIKLFTNPKDSASMLLVAVYGDRVEGNLRVPLKMYQWYSGFNGHIDGASFDLGMSGNYDTRRERGWTEINPSHLQADELKHYKNVLNHVHKSIENTVKHWKEKI
jgi:hypothetical protein